jgi:hypothetical protein
MKTIRSFKKRWVLTSFHMVLLILLLCLFDARDFTIYEKIGFTFAFVSIIVYGICGEWRQSFLAGLFAIIIILICHYHYHWFMMKKETFLERFSEAETKEEKEKKISAAGKGTPPTEIKPGNTRDMDDTGLKEEDLDTILESDKKAEEEGDHKQKEAFSKAGGGLDGLEALLNQARQESVYNEKKSADDFTPAQAQRQTHRLIDTVEQLKTTMTEMLPLMKSGGNLIELYQKMGGKDLVKAFQ